MVVRWMETGTVVAWFRNVVFKQCAEYGSPCAAHHSLPCKLRTKRLTAPLSSTARQVLFDRPLFAIKHSLSYKQRTQLAAPGYFVFHYKTSCIQPTALFSTTFTTV